jgi:hypothetical protein
MLASGAEPAGRQNLGLENCLGFVGIRTGDKDRQCFPGQGIRTGSASRDKDRQCFPAEQGPAAARTSVWKIA